MCFVGIYQDEMFPPVQKLLGRPIGNQIMVSGEEDQACKLHIRI
jgi:hypothetical protein